MADALELFPESHKISIDNLEISNLGDDELDRRVEDAFLFQEHRDEVGKVASISDGVASVTGLKNCMANELIEFSSGATGIAMNLEKSKVGEDVPFVAGLARTIGRVCGAKHRRESCPKQYFHFC